jgi:hypothetical protein
MPGSKKEKGFQQRFSLPPKKEKGKGAHKNKHAKKDKGNGARRQSDAPNNGKGKRIIFPFSYPFSFGFLFRPGPYHFTPILPRLACFPLYLCILPALREDQYV